MPENARKVREKQAREEEILDAAEMIFGKKGFDGALMEDIAREAQFTRKTLYQYFGSKEELLSAVILRGYKMLLSCLSAGEGRIQCGAERLRTMGVNFYGFFMGHTNFFSLFNYMSRVKDIGGEVRRKEFADTDQALFALVSEAIEAGKADGSIRKDVDTAMTTASFIFTVTGFFCQFALSGASFTDHLSLDADRFIRYTMDLMIASVGSKE